MNFKTQNLTIDDQSVTVVEIELEEGEVLRPDQLTRIQPPHLSGMQGVIISGRAAPKDLCNAEQSRTLPSIAAFFLLQRPMTSGRVHPYHPARGISTGVTSRRADGS